MKRGAGYGLYEQKGKMTNAKKGVIEGVFERFGSPEGRTQPPRKKKGPVSGAPLHKRVQITAR